MKPLMLFNIACLAFLSVSVFADVRVVMGGKFGDQPQALEFRDDTGVLERTISKGRADDSNNMVNFSTQELATTAALVPARTNFLVSENYFLVTVSQGRHVTMDEYQETGIPFATRHQTSLYDSRGNRLSFLPDLTCEPIAMSANGNKFLCYYEPTEASHTLGYAEHVDENLKRVGLYIYQKRGSQWQVSQFRGRGELSGALLSPNGQWMAMPGVEYEPGFREVFYLYSLRPPVSAQPYQILEGKKTKDISKVGNNGELLIDHYEVRVENNQPIKNITRTEIFYQP